MRKNPNSKQQKRLLKNNAGVCCVCKDRGLGINFHHIDGNNSNTVDENLAVLCVKDHDAHHRPTSYSKPNHLELGAARILELKKSWESFVMESAKPNPKTLAVLNIFGNDAGIHSMKLVFQWERGKIEFERVYHLLLGSIDSWIDHALDEINWISKNMKLVTITDVLEPEYCPSCSFSLTNTVDENLSKKVTAQNWKSDSICSIYINPTQPSLAILVSLSDQILYKANLHICNGFLHFVGSKYDERLKIKRKPSVRTQATKIIKKVISDWEPGNIFLGTGNPDSPSLINDFILPKFWEKKTNITVKNLVNKDV